MNNKEQIFYKINSGYEKAAKLTGNYNGPINKFIAKKGKRIAISWSGGKDSCFVLYKALELGFNVKYLFVVTDESGDTSLTWPYNLDLLNKQAESIGIELIKVKISSDPVEGFKTFCEFLISNGVESLGFGYYIYEGQREFVQKVIYKYGLSIFEPNLGVNQEKRLLEILKVGIKPMIIGVMDNNIDKNYLGKILDLDFYRYLKTKFNYEQFCGENGDFQTFVIKAPMFKKIISINKYYTFDLGPNVINYYF